MKKLITAIITGVMLSSAVVSFPAGAQTVDPNVVTFPTADGGSIQFDKDLADAIRKQMAADAEKKKLDAMQEKINDLEYERQDRKENAHTAKRVVCAVTSIGFETAGVITVLPILFPYIVARSCFVLGDKLAKASQE